jgi:repressor LexA
MVQRSLTLRQQEIYDFVKDKIMNRGYGPTVREIGSHFSIRSPNGVMCHLKALERKGLISRESHMSRAIQLTDAPQLKRSSLPMAGIIAAGSPLLAEEDYESKDFSGLFNNKEHFCLKVKGDSMIEDHIQDGDFVVIKKGDTCREGDVVAALVDNNEATLKRFYRDHDRYRLEPANKNMKPIYSTNVKILGKLIGVIRVN